MTPKKQAPDPKPDTAALPLWRLAEVIQMRRQTVHTPGGSSWFFECQLCLGKSSVDGQIVHKDHCPIERMKHA